MRDISRNPVEWDLITWAWVVFFIMFGGWLNWLTKPHSGGQHKIAHLFVVLLGDLTLSLLIGIPTFMVLHNGTDLDAMVSLGLAIVAGHGGTRFICKIEAFVSALACKNLGVDPDVLNKFESTSFQLVVPPPGVCVPYYHAMYAVQQEGVPMRHVLWPAGQFISMPSQGAFEVTADQLWSQSNAKFARRQTDQKVLVLPTTTMKMADGTILNGWTPTVADMSIPGWMVVTDEEIEQPTSNGEKPKT